MPGAGLLAVQRARRSPAVLVQHGFWSAGKVCVALRGCEVTSAQVGPLPLAGTTLEGRATRRWLSLAEALSCAWCLGGEWSTARLCSHEWP